MIIITILIYIFLAIGVFFDLLAAIGLIRFPDVYTRLHAGTKCTTFGSIFLSGAVILYGLREWYIHPDGGIGSILPIHVFIALIAILVTNPTGAHAIARAAHRSGVLPVGAVIDDLQDDEKKSKKDTDNKSGGKRK